MDTSSFPSLPSDHPASIQLSSWLSAFNTQDKDTLLTYHNSNFSYTTVKSPLVDIDRELTFFEMTGGFHVADIEDTSTPSKVVAVIMEKNERQNRHQYGRVEMEVDVEKENYPVTGFGIRPINTPLKLIPEDDPRRERYEKAYKTLTGELRQKIIDGLADVLRDQYIYPDQGEVIITALETHLKDGDYDAFDDSTKFTKCLTHDMQTAGHDQHMSIHFIEPPEGITEENLRDKPKEIIDIEHLRRMNFGFHKISFDEVSIPGKAIATLPIRAFVPSKNPEICAAIAEIISSIADADALIIDLRENGGGDPNTVAFIESFILDHAPQHLLDFVDRSGKVDDSFYTLAKKDLPAGSKVFGASKPLYVLTTNQTISGGEDMAYSLQAFKRASAIIGQGNEATAGAANPVTKPRFICEEEFGKMWWMVGVPNLKPVHEVTGANWEGVGVKSDVVAGKGEWEGVEDAKVVASQLVVKELKSEGRGKEL